jgi:hypothetical protein
MLARSSSSLTMVKRLPEIDIVADELGASSFTD